MLTYLLFVVGFLFLIKGADLLVDGSTSIAKRLNIPNIVIGLTIVAFGTSAPELFVSVLASIQGNTGIAIGNVLGSNIANVFLILGASALIYPIVAPHNTVVKEIPFSLLAALALAVVANDVRIDGSSSSIITRIDGIILLLFFAIFLYYTYEASKRKDAVTDIIDVKTYSYGKSILLILVGLTGLALGGRRIVNGAVSIAHIFDVSDALIGVTIIAIGTSLPELATSAIAAYKKQSDIAIGNIVGSNIFNVFRVLGLSAVVYPLPFQESLNIDAMIGIAGSIILFSIMFIGKRYTIERRQGALFLIFYVGYIVLSIVTH